MTARAPDAELSCTICGKPVLDRRWKPFCSRRCADVDLGRWLTGSYRVPTDEAETGENPA